MKWREAGEDCIMRSFIHCYLGSSSQGTVDLYVIQYTELKQKAVCCVKILYVWRRASLYAR
jgi:hypothetical protein